MTIEQTVTIPADHRVTLDVPREVPAGATARFELFLIPRKEADNSLDSALERIRALCKDAPITVDSFSKMRRMDKELEENQYRKFFSMPEESN
jgi:predicted nuclease with RNAse H fold